MDSQLIAIPLTAFAVLTTMTGGLVALRMAHSLPTVIALSGGIVVAVALFDVLPEAIDLLPDDSTAIGALMGAGFLTFFLFERVLESHASVPATTVETVREADHWARVRASELVRKPC